jgi:hypothetical protein
MLKLARKLWQRTRDLFPVSGFHFDRPLVLFESDDWGRVGLRDRDGLEQLRKSGLQLGERPYDLYTLETAEDLSALRTVLKRHRDSSGRHPGLEMNFVLANLDLAKMSKDAFRQIHLLPLADGLPESWSRPGLIQAYREGIADGIFHPALHGMMHFCHRAVERGLAREDERVELLRTLWRAGTPYIHWRMPWVGYEYWDAEKPEDERFLPAEAQRQLIGQAVGAFAKLFSCLPRSACAPGYRANHDTCHAWAQHGIRVAQNGPDVFVPPHFDHCGILHLTRTVEFEPAVAPAFSIEACLQRVGRCFEQGVPAILSVHSINFHSTVRDFRSPTLRFLDEFLTALEAKYSDLLYLHDEDLHALVTRGSYRTASSDVPNDNVRINVTTKKFTRAGLARVQKA